MLQASSSGARIDLKVSSSSPAHDAIIDTDVPSAPLQSMASCAATGATSITINAAISSSDTRFDMMGILLINVSNTSLREPFRYLLIVPPPVSVPSLCDQGARGLPLYHLERRQLGNHVHFVSFVT